MPQKPETSSRCVADSSPVTNEGLLRRSPGRCGSHSPESILSSKNPSRPRRDGLVTAAVRDRKQARIVRSVPRRSVSGLRSSNRKLEETRSVAVRRALRGHDSPQLQRHPRPDRERQRSKWSKSVPNSDHDPHSLKRASVRIRCSGLTGVASAVGASQARRIRHFIVRGASDSTVTSRSWRAPPRDRRRRLNASHARVHENVAA